MHTSRFPYHKRWLVMGLLGLLMAHAHAGLGLAELPGLAGDGPITVFYPTTANDQPIKRGVFTLDLAWQAAPLRGNGRLIVVSHGSGGSPWVHADLARVLVDAGYVVAVPQHRADHSQNMADAGPESWKRRPAEVSRAIDALAQSALFAPLLVLDRVGVYGGSAGGHTALSLAGGRWSPASFRQHCAAHIEDDFSSCAGFVTRLRGNPLDWLKKQIVLGVHRQRFDDDTWYTHHDARVAAAVGAVPFAADFDMASLARPRIPLGLVMAGRDINQVPRFHVGAVRATCASCETVADMPQAGHGVMLSPMPPPEVMTGIAQELNGDPPGFDRASEVPAMNARIAAFFKRHIAPSK